MKKSSSLKPVIGLGIILAIGLGLFFWGKSERQEFGSGYSNIQASRSIKEKIEVTKEWSKWISGGLPWYIKEKDMAYIVEYDTEQGILSEKIPARRDRGKDWKPLYENPVAIGVRFRLPEGCHVERAEMLIYTH